MLSIIRFKRIRIYRDIISVPILYIFLFTVIAAILYVIYQQLNKTPNSYIVGVLSILVLLSVHTGRKDKGFCRHMMKMPQKLFITEYFMLCSPLIILSFMAESFYNIIFYCLLPVLIAYVPERKPRNSFKSRLFLFGVTSLELVGFIRKHLPFIMILITLSIITCFIPFLPILILLLFLIFMNIAYNENEPLNILLLSEHDSMSFIMKKINDGFLLFLKLSFPTLILYSVFNFDTAWLVPVVPVIAYIAFTLHVGLKYTFYENDNSKTNIPAVAAIGILGIIIPIFLPLTIIQAISYFFQAKQNLNKYLYVYNK